jgi:hypothetical protein
MFLLVEAVLEDANNNELEEKNKANENDVSQVKDQSVSLKPYSLHLSFWCVTTSRIDYPV